MFKNNIFSFSKSGLVLGSLGLIFFSGFNTLNAAKDNVSIQDIQSQAIINCKLYAKMQMLALLDASIKLDGVDAVIDNVYADTKDFQDNLKSKYKSIYKNCVRENYNSINRVRIGNINKAYKKYQYNYQANKGYITSFKDSLDNKELLNKYVNILDSK